MSTSDTGNPAMKDEARGKAAMILKALSETARTTSDRLLRDRELTVESLRQDLAAMEAQLRRARSAMSDHSTTPPPSR